MHEKIFHNAIEDIKKVNSILRNFFRGYNGSITDSPLPIFTKTSYANTDNFSGSSKTIEENFMNQVESNIVQAVEQVAPNAPAVQVAEAALSTVSNPSIANILADIELVISLSKQIKALAASHPTIASVVSALF